MAPDLYASTNIRNVNYITQIHTFYCSVDDILVKSYWIPIYLVASWNIIPAYR